MNMSMVNLSDVRETTATGSSEIMEENLVGKVRNIHVYGENSDFFQLYGTHIMLYFR